MTTEEKAKIAAVDAYPETGELSNHQMVAFYNGFIAGHNAAVEAAIARIKKVKEDCWNEADNSTPIAMGADIAFDRILRELEKQSKE